MLFNLVHHNPGEPRFVTEFNDPRHLKELGYTGWIPKLEPQCGLTYDRYDRHAVPLHSVERQWILRQAAEFRKQIAIARKAGLPVYPWIDVLVIPKVLMAKYGNEMRDEKKQITILKPRTRELLVAQIDEFFWRYPELGGLTVRFGETYLHDTPYHTGGSPVRTAEEHAELLKILREEVCVKRNRKVVYRTWDFGRLHTRPEIYLAATDAVEPHSNLVFSIKHSNSDFGRNIPFNKTIGIGRHSQIIEVSMNQGGNYGKNAYPYYFARGVLEGFNDMPPATRRGLRSAEKTPIVRGIWTWTWGDGWSGPFFSNEMWMRLNEGVVRGYALHPEKSEEDLFNEVAWREFGLSGVDLKKFRAFCLATEDAVYLGQHSRFGRCSDDMFWCRDNHICRFNLDQALANGVVAKMLAEKKANLETWRRLERDIRAIRFAKQEDERFATLSTTYARIKYELSEILWRMMARVSEEKAGKTVVAAEEASELLAEFDAKYSEWDNLVESDPDCPTPYETHFGWRVVIGPHVDALRQRAAGDMSVNLWQNH